MTDPANAFRKLGHQVIDLLGDYLEQQQADCGRVLNWTPPNEAFAEWPQPGGFESVTDLFQQVMEQSISLHHPRYMGHQINPPVLESALAGLVVDLLNNGMGVYEMGMAGTLMERRIIELTARKYGFDQGASGFLTSGGTLGNLTALVSARQAYLRRHPELTDHQLALVTSPESHYCIQRAVQIMGWGDDGIVQVPVNEQFEMRVDLLPQLVDDAVSNGKQVIGVVGVAGSTSTGSYDDLVAIGTFCRDRGLWFHVDGAHGAALAFSDSCRHRVQGLELADSVVMDFHKMLLVPPLITSVIFRDGRQSYETFRQQAEYLWDENPDSSSFSEADHEWYNLARRTFECTKSMMSLKVYALLTAYGLDYLDQHVARLVKLGQRFGEMIKARARFELPVDPVINIVCFRFTDPSLDPAALNRLNARIRSAIVQEGRFYIVQTMIHGITYLRTALTNPATHENHLEELLDHIESLADQDRQAE